MRVPDGNPANPLYRIEQLAGRVVELERLVQMLRDEQRTYSQRGTITAYVGGATTCTVTFAGGKTATCRYPVGYTPTVGHIVFAVLGPEGRIIIGRDSVP